MQYAICKQFETFHTLFGKLEVYTVDLMECIHSVHEILQKCIVYLNNNNYYYYYNYYYYVELQWSSTEQQQRQTNYKTTSARRRLNVNTVDAHKY